MMSRKPSMDPYATELPDWTEEETLTVPAEQLREVLSAVYLAGIRSDWPVDLEEYEVNDPDLLALVQRWMAYVDAS